MRPQCEDGALRSFKGAPPLAGISDRLRGPGHRRCGHPRLLARSAFRVPRERCVRAVLATAMERIGRPRAPIRPHHHGDRKGGGCPSPVRARARERKR